MRPASRSTIACAVHLYEMCVICVFVAALNSSTERWLPPPGPDEPNASSLGRCLASAMNSLSVLTGNEGCTTTTCGVKPIIVMGTKSLIGSYVILDWSTALLTYPRQPNASV